MIVDHRAQCARREDLRACVENLFSVNNDSVKLLNQTPRFISIDVAHDQFRARVVQIFREVVADIPATLERNYHSRKIFTFPEMLCRRLYRTKDSARRER